MDDWEPPDVLSVNIENETLKNKCHICDDEFDQLDIRVTKQMTIKDNVLIIWLNIPGKRSQWFFRKRPNIAIPLQSKTEKKIHILLHNTVGKKWTNLD